MLNALGGIQPQAGQVATIGLVGELLVVQAAGCGHQGRGSVAVDLDAFPVGIQVEQGEDFQFSDQFGGKDMGTPDFQTRTEAP